MFNIYIINTDTYLYVFWQGNQIGDCKPKIFLNFLVANDILISYIYLQVAKASSIREKTIWERSMDWTKIFGALAVILGEVIKGRKRKK